jgi:D-arabinose 1-dehydrogenase-like Zn-dependent alcohol dehydrogenase
MRAVAVTKPGKVEIVELGRPTAGPYQALVRTEVACLCNATDAKLIAGHFPGVEKYPLVLGHESVGIVEAVGGKVRNFRIGQRAVGGLVFDFSDPAYSSGWGGFCEYTLANDHDAMVADGVAGAEHGWIENYEIQRPVPMDIPVEAALLMCTWREVYGGFGDFGLKRRRDILVFGAGPVGLSFVKLGKLLGFGLYRRGGPARNQAPPGHRNGSGRSVRTGGPALIDGTAGQPLDAVRAVGKESIANAALSLIGMGGSICIYGVLAEPSITIHKHQGPYNFNLFVHQWPTRSRERAAMEPLCDWVRQGKLRAADFITHEFPWSGSPTPSRQSAAARRSRFSCVIDWRYFSSSRSLPRSMVTGWLGLVYISLPSMTLAAEVEPPCPVAADDDVAMAAVKRAVLRRSSGCNHRKTRRPALRAGRVGHEPVLALPVNALFGPSPLRSVTAFPLASHL